MPFKYDSSRPSVFWASGDGPYNNTRKVLANIDLSPTKNKRVLLKPNVGRNVERETGVTTHPQVVAAAIDAFREAGAEVAVGESPIAGVKMLSAFESSGITTIAEERNCLLIDMDVHPHVPVEIPDGVAIKTLKICKEVAEYDIIVSIATPARLVAPGAVTVSTYCIVFMLINSILGVSSQVTKIYSEQGSIARPIAC